MAQLPLPTPLVKLDFAISDPHLSQIHECIPKMSEARHGTDGYISNLRLVSMGFSYGNRRPIACVALPSL